MSIPDRTSPEVAGKILANLLPSDSGRKTVSGELASFWQYAKRMFPDNAFITLAQRYIRMNVGMVEVLVIRPNGICLVVDKAMVDPEAEPQYKSCEDAHGLHMAVGEFIKRIANLRPAVFSIINKLGRTRKHPTSHRGHSPGLAQLLASDFPYNSVLDCPEEVAPDFREGKCRTIAVNAYERDPAARAACLRHYGTFVCHICGFDFARVYGSIGEEFIHVHHLRPLAAHGCEGERTLHPETDLIPVCPNCHAMLHTRKPEPLSPQELRERIGKQSSMCPRETVA